MEKKIIVVADDDLEVCSLFKFLLEREGYIVKEAHTGKEFLVAIGLEVAENEEDKPFTPVTPDLIFLDVMLPEIDGYTLALRLQQSEPLSKTPIIVVTAKERMSAVFSEFPNIKGFFSKPFDPKTVKEKVRSLLG